MTKLEYNKEKGNYPLCNLIFSSCMGELWKGGKRQNIIFNVSVSPVVERCQNELQGMLLTGERVKQ
jgi:hypothetical protein